MEEVKGLLRTLVQQLDESAERDLVARLNQEQRDVTLNSIHSSIEGVREAVLEVEYKVDQIEMRLETIEKNLNKK
ncbi:hypothetical protein R2F61_03400 [Mollicutes bacterium LVI A0078]|nr:hypothetical protein RZE84_03430 [Mollicutes bacterium LVI A0075]WOO91610.1 hypothetical protein R2F61_03400 [Mollicutes bacterium LVI A0078]